MILTVLDEEEGGTKRKERRGERRDEEEGGTRGKERRGGRSNEEEEGSRRKTDGPGPVMVSDTLCPAVHILGT